ncbi:uncharacterized protein RJT20DRAFT_8411 [Scheffersomyces xylosifermentans]|uniref:uncharacterized protein n=1 Tax=Scheffersomyces xylosifermentans TaxID=1304137 RepID=UPI00315DE65C
MINLKPYYKEFCRRIHRLPLTRDMISRLMAITKYKLVTVQPYNPKFDKRKYKNSIKLLDDILVDEKYDKLHDLLDVIFKTTIPVPAWKTAFLTMPFLQLQDHWPQVHAIHELTKVRAQLKPYEEALKEEANEDHSVMKFFNLSTTQDKDLPKLEMTRSYSKGQGSNIKEIVENVAILHKFIFKHSGVLDVKVPPLEVLYPTNKYALPIHHKAREKLFKEKIAAIRNLFKALRPIKEEDLQILYEFAIHRPSGSNKPECAINTRFYKYMIKKHKAEEKSLAPIIRHYLRQKKLIPNDHNIRKIFREYVMKQFYEEDKNVYRISWMQNFYENESSLLKSIQLSDYKENIESTTGRGQPTQ